MNRPSRIPTADIVRRSLPRRYKKERRFLIYGALSIVVCFLFLGIFFSGIFRMGWRAFFETRIKLPIYLDPELILPYNIKESDYGLVISQSLQRFFPDVTSRQEKRELSKLLGAGVEEVLKEFVIKHPEAVGSAVEIWLPAGDGINLINKGVISKERAIQAGLVTEGILQKFEQLSSDGRVSTGFNSRFFTSGDSHTPSMAGIGGAIVGSFYLMVVTFFLSFPIGVGAAIYLEECAPKSRLTDIIDININNLTAVPSIIFGLIGLAIFLNFFKLPRSSPLVGGLVLSLMTIPVIVIASKSALKSVPPSIREAALGVGASKIQTIFHHVVPLALPGMFTGAILGMARAVGETAPLLMVGMVAFVVDIPKKLMDPASALPVQIYLWSDQPDRAFNEKAAAAIIVLIFFMIAMNSAAIFLRKKYERKY
ncbi:MAG: phosphate ABC transporter permease PstA [Syntrophobacterales bacterium]|nr:phosphate ABC transporter permease PstA [Syntrophobacterales bacterium]